MYYLSIISGSSYKLLLFVLLLIGGSNAKAQVVNGYARVDNLSGQTLSLTNVDESSDSFEDGEQVIIMQMQDTVIGDNYDDDSTFGTISSIESAGLWEVRKIQSHVESGGEPTSITLQDPLNNVYNPNSSLQVISFPDLGSPDYTMTTDQSAKDWNGTTGGILAFEVSGTLTLESDIDADSAGYRGGNASDGSSGDCNPWNHFSQPSGQYAEKGEGIKKAAQDWYAGGRGKLANGGGGGNEHNAGGGGGANYSKGGKGGKGYNCSQEDPTGSGYGGEGLSGSISSFRFFMGGGGGGGEGNDGLATDGGDGGGILIIKADEIRTTSSCSGVFISADGGTASDAGNDGAGGGGAGGTVHFLVDSWDIDASCPLTISSNGGDGGDVNASDYHAGGGGGGQGAVIHSGAVPSSNTTTNTQPGTGGRNCDGCETTESGSGSNGDGISATSGGPLPIELLYFEAERRGSRVLLSWRTMSEERNERFTVQRSKRGKEWEDLESIDGAGTSVTPRDYSTWDMEPFSSRSYYRLRQTDLNGMQSYSEPATVGPVQKGDSPRIRPNPAENRAWVENNSSMTILRLYDHRGRELDVRTEISGKRGELSVSGLSPGVYLVEFGTERELTRKRLVVD